MLLVVRDRTDELKREQAEREFVSNAAHELRNPLAGISSAIEVLRGGAKDDPEARERFLDRLADDTERMTRLTQSLLTLARVEAAGERDDAEVVDVTLAALESAAGGRARPPGSRSSPRSSPTWSPRATRCCSARCWSACSRTRAGTPLRPARLPFAPRRDDSGEVTIEVQDTGKGIPADEQDRVFERFYRGSGALEGDGFGLGLSIAKRMVNVMGGEIGVYAPTPAAARPSGCGCASPSRPRPRSPDDPVAPRTRPHPRRRRRALGPRVGRLRARAGGLRRHPRRRRRGRRGPDRRQSTSTS